MRKNSFIPAALIAAATLALSGVPGQASPVLGSHVDSSVFSSVSATTAGWSYLGQSTSAFTGSGTGTLDLKLSSFGDSFGYSKDNYSSMTQVFGSSAIAGATSIVSGFSPSFLFYFQAIAGNSPTNVTYDNNTQFTDGHSIGSTQGDIDIFKNSGTGTWAFFFDDGGPNTDLLLGFIPVEHDDNDYNDLVVTFTQTPASVPEPGSLSILGISLIGLGFLMRRKRTSVPS